MTGESADPDRAAAEPAASTLTLAFLRGLVENGSLRPGDRLAPERELARQIGVSRSGLRECLRSLAALGVVSARQGAGTFITAGPPVLASEPLGLLTALHGISRDRLFEARRVLESSIAALAAERANGDQVAAMSHEITGMFATLERPEAFLRHDFRFHRAVATGANNLVLGAFVGMMTALHLEAQRAGGGETRDGLRDAADRHRRIYQAIRNHDAEAARAAMDENLGLAQAGQALG
jgi:GntR family transcriptional repressor for pyruvate dehydrogenase complex